MPVDHVKFNPMASNVSWKQQLCKHHTVLSVLKWSPINRMFLSVVSCWSWCWLKVLAEICLTGNDVEVGIMWLVAFLINQWDLSLALADQSEEGCEYHSNMVRSGKSLARDEKFTCSSLTFPLCSSILPTSTDTFSELCKKLVYSNLLKTVCFSRWHWVLKLYQQYYLYYYVN